MVFGVILIILGVLVFTNQLVRIANVPFLTELISMGGGESVGVGAGLGFGIAFLAGLASFLSPCVLPLIPAFLAYLGTTVTTGKKEEDNEITATTETKKDE